MMMFLFNSLIFYYIKDVDINYCPALLTLCVKQLFHVGNHVTLKLFIHSIIYHPLPHTHTQQSHILHLGDLFLNSVWNLVELKTCGI